MEVSQIFTVNVQEEAFSKEYVRTTDEKRLKEQEDGP